jgi:hypothetical protein
VLDYDKRISFAYFDVLVSMRETLPEAFVQSTHSAAVELRILILTDSILTVEVE